MLNTNYLTYLVTKFNHHFYFIVVYQQNSNMVTIFVTINNHFIL